jgi:hypothetical protein
MYISPQWTACQPSREASLSLTSLRTLLSILPGNTDQSNVYIGQPTQIDTGRDDPRVTSLQATLTLYQQLYLNLLNNLEAVKLARVTEHAHSLRR